MLFNSFHFVFKFFPLVTLAFFLTPHRFRWALLLAASTYFYVVFVPKYLLILGALILVDYISAILIARQEGPWRRRWLILSLLSNIGILGLFKYFNFFNENVAAVAHLLGWNYGIKNLTWFLPLGLSFHTFQSMAYTIEVYRRRQEPEKHLGVYALYVMFYPQVVAGPIERPQHMLPQFHEEKKFDFERVTSGLQLMVWGMFKKAFVADTLAIIVDQVYLKPHAHEGWSLPYMVSTYAFCFQVYCDFSGYSDVARGAGRVMGYEMVENFRYPFIAQSVAEFWQRWHVSLSTWFRDYMYLPLVYSTRDGKGAIRVNMTYFYILLVFMTSGFWHGAAWHYGLWGLSHGAIIATGSLLKPIRARTHKRLNLDRYRTLHGLYKVFVTFHIIWFTFVLVRADSVPDAVIIMRNIIVSPLNLRRGWSEYCLENTFQLGALGVLIVVVVEKLQRTDAWAKLERMKLGFSFKQVFYAALVVLIIIAAPMLDRAFIYFQFEDTMVEEFLAQIFRRRPTQEKKLKAFFEREPEALRELDAFLVAYRPIWEGPKVGGLDGLADAYSQVVGEIMMCRVEFLRTGRYPLASQTEAFESVYADDGRMLSYMLGLGVSQYLWQAHYRLLSFFKECVAAQSPSARTLEVGSGHGILINHVASRASADAVIDVVDISASSIALSKALLTATNPEVARRIRFVESDIARYEAPNPYDFIVLGEVLEHVEAPSGILQALHRVLADDGSLYITTCANCPAVDHVYLFRNVEEIRELIRGSGFTIAQEVVAPTEDKPLEYHERLKLDILYGALLRKA